MGAREMLDNIWLRATLAAMASAGLALAALAAGWLHRRGKKTGDTLRQTL